jgi:hypothetical protein
MHPKMMIALANEVQRNRESELQGVRLRSVAVAVAPRGSNARWRRAGLRGGCSTVLVCGRALVAVLL